MPDPENSSLDRSEFDQDIERISDWVAQSNAPSGFERTISRISRWLMIAAFIGLAFVGFCMMVAITIAAIMFKGNVFQRGELYAGFVFLTFGIGLAYYVKNRLLVLDEPNEAAPQSETVSVDD